MYDVIVDIVTLPEFIQSEFSHAESKGRKFGALRAVKKLKKPYTRPGTSSQLTTKWILRHLCPSQPPSGIFLTKGDRYQWKADYRKVFRAASEELYKCLG